MNNQNNNFENMNNNNYHLNNHIYIHLYLNSLINNQLYRNYFQVNNLQAVYSLLNLKILELKKILII